MSEYAIPTKKDEIKITSLEKMINKLQYSTDTEKQKSAVPASRRSTVARRRT